jgi:Tfp pilus assembly protein PilO
MAQSTKTALAVAVVIALAGAFWLLLLAPKREQANELSEQITTLQAEVTSETQRAAEAAAAKRDFPEDYHQLVLLGKAVPADAATPSLLVQLNGVGERAETTFVSIQQGGGSGEEGGGTGGSGGTPSEAAATLPPLGASAGPAGLASMPYTLSFEGGCFDIANFIGHLDGLVTTKDGRVDAKGRLVTIDGFNLTPNQESGGDLTGSFNVTAYVTPPGQGLTAGASAAGPGTATTPNLP